MLVIPDQFALRVGTQGGLSSTREAEQIGNIPCRTHIGRTVHGQDPFQGHQVIHHREDPLLHFTGVLGAKDYNFLSLQVYIHRGFGSHLGSVGIRWESPGIHDHVIRSPKIRELFGRWHDQHILHKEGVIGTGADDADFDPVFGVPAGKGIHHKEAFAYIQVIDGAFPVDKIGLLIQADIHIPPVDIVFRIRVFYDPLVLRASSCLFT